MSEKAVLTRDAALRSHFSRKPPSWGRSRLYCRIYLMRSCDESWLAVTGIHSLAMTTLFLTSGLPHGLYCSESTVVRLEKLDYAGIYLLIAGTYTPVFLRVMPGSFGHGLLITEWALALIGIWLSLVHGPTHRKLQVLSFLGMGWGFVFAIPSLFTALQRSLWICSYLVARFIQLGQ